MLDAIPLPSLPARSEYAKEHATLLLGKISSEVHQKNQRTRLDRLRGAVEREL